MVILNVSSDSSGSTVLFENMSTCQHYMLKGEKMVRRNFDCHEFVISVCNMLGMKGIYPHSWMERPHALLHKWFMGIFSTYAA